VKNYFFDEELFMKWVEKKDFKGNNKIMLDFDFESYLILPFLRRWY
jgi:hypothetical protein